MSRKYCKAYYLKDVKAFAGWSEPSEQGAATSADDDVVYLWDDFTVVKSPVLPGGVLFDEVTTAWKDFCTTTLQFHIPEDLRYAYEDEDKKNASSHADVKEGHEVAR